MGITSIPAGIEAELGGHLVNQGATFRLWAPNAREVYLIWGDQDRAQRPAAEWRLEGQGEHFAGFVAPARDGDCYRYWIVGPDGEGPKRDPHARELEWQGYPDCDCILRDPASYPWASDGRYRRPQPHELVLYQLHVGTFFYQDSVQRPPPHPDRPFPGRARPVRTPPPAQRQRCSATADHRVANQSEPRL